MSRTLFLCAAAALCIQTASALKCYHCNSHNDSRCAEEKPPAEFSRDCNEIGDGKTYSMCRKILQIIEFPVNGLQPDTRIIRSCAWDDTTYKGRCYQRSGFGGRQEVCSCLTDLCNGSSNNVNVPIMTVIVVGISSVLMRVVL